ncbi:MAG TPA: YggT family protein [Gammaproteobacteria bacterium]|jgi:YggT family protein|nr:YggT family protein [Gammaproteobacteria bacterium]
MIGIDRGTQALIFVINTLFGLYSAAILLRLLLQWVHADFYNPLSQAIVKLTNLPLQPLRRVIPGWHGIDFAALLLTAFIQLLNVLLVLWIASVPAGVIAVMFWTVLKLVFILVNLYFFSILLEAILSWTGQGRHNPVSSMLWQLNAPLLGPVRRVMPPLGGLDLSPLVVIILLQVINILLPLGWPLT